MADFERLPPQNTDAEKCVIASMALDHTVIPVVRGILNKEEFFQTDHQVMFAVLCEMHSAGRSIDAVTMRAELQRRGLLDEVGGTAYIAECLNAIPTSAHALHYAGIVKEKATWRAIITTSNELLREAYAPQGEDDAAPSVAAEYARRLSRIAAEGKANEVVKLGDVACDVIRRLDEGETARYIRTGLMKLDDMIGGLRIGGKTIVGGKPGMGKSLLLKQMLRNIARRMPVGLITVEEDREKIAENALSSESGVPNNRIAFNRLREGDAEKLTASMPALDGLPFYIIDTARKLSRIIAAANTLAVQYGCKVIGVDHLHIIDAEVGQKNPNREYEISQISGDLKWAWRELNVAGIEAAQLNRKDGRERPNIESLRGSGSLGQDGDTILLLHREDYYRKEDNAPADQFDGVLEVIVAKNKSGSSAHVELYIEEATQTITDPPVSDPFQN